MLLYVSIFTILLSLLLLFNNWVVNKNAAFLSMFLINSSIYGIAHYFVVYGKSPFWLAVFYNHFTPLMLLLGPFLLFYVRGTLNDSYRMVWYDFLHFIPALIHLIGIIPYSVQPWEKKMAIANTIINDIDFFLDICSFEEDSFKKNKLYYSVLTEMKSMINVFFDKHNQLLPEGQEYIIMHEKLMHYIKDKKDILLNQMSFLCDKMLFAIELYYERKE